MMVILKMEMGVLQHVKSKINMNVIQAQYLQGVFIKKVMTYKQNQLLKISWPIFCT